MDKFESVILPCKLIGLVLSGSHNMKYDSVWFTSVHLWFTSQSWHRDYSLLGLANGRETVVQSMLPQLLVVKILLMYGEE